MSLRRDKMQMVQAEDALPGRDVRPFEVPARHYVLDTPTQPPFPEGLQQAVFAPNPTYEEVCSGGSWLSQNTWSNGTGVSCPVGVLDQ